MKYHLVSVIDNVKEFRDEVNRLLGEGWVLYGNPIVTVWKSTGSYQDEATYTEYCQAMTKNEP